jgi:hypothetical protein
MNTTNGNGQRDFKAIIDEWTQTMLDLNRVEGRTITEIGLITHLGLLGQKLIYESNAVGMQQTADMVKEMNK